MLDYNPILLDIQKIIRKHIHLLHSSTQIKEICPSKSVFPAYHRTKNLKEILALSKFRSTVTRNQREGGGCSKCGKRCDLRKKYLTSNCQIRKLSRRLPMSHLAKTHLFIRKCYLFSHVQKYNLKHVGSTSTKFKVRFFQSQIKYAQQ